MAEPSSADYEEIGRIVVRFAGLPDDVGTVRLVARNGAPPEIIATGVQWYIKLAAMLPEAGRRMKLNEVVVDDTIG